MVFALLGCLQRLPHQKEERGNVKIRKRGSAWAREEERGNVKKCVQEAGSALECGGCVLESGSC
jgi:hypothetical protein